MKHHLRLVLAVAAAVLLTSCDYDDYDVLLKPDGPVLERIVTCSRMGDAPATQPGEKPASGGPVPKPMRPETVEHLDAVYGKPSGTVGPKRIYTGRFTHETPGDVGGAGRYQFFDSPMGSSSSYAERFRGDPDAAGRIARMQAAADRVTDLLIGWLGGELKNQPGWPALRKTLDQDLRHDLKNVGVYAWLGIEGNRQVKDPQDMAVRAALYLAERGYWSPDQAPTIAAAVTSEGRASRVQPALDLIRSWIARKMGVPATRPIPRSLAFLGSIESLQKSLAAYLGATKEYQTLLDKWRREQEKNSEHPATKPLTASKGSGPEKEKTPDHPRPEPMQVLADAWQDLLAPGDLFEVEHDHVRVRLLCGVKPFRNNGQWDPATKTLSWSDDLPGDSVLPLQCYAFWSSPDERYQIEHLGKVALEGEPLALYVLWYRGLTTPQRTEWDRFIEHLHPAPKLADQVNSFHFSDDPAATQPARAGNEPPSVAKPAIDAIVRGLSDK